MTDDQIIPITRRDKAGAGQQCWLEFGTDSLLLISPDGQPWIRWTPEQLSLAVTFPSFSRSIKFPQFTIPGYPVMSFELYGNGLKRLRDFSDRGIINGGAARLAVLLWEALATIAVGAIVVALCAQSLLVVIKQFASPGNPGNGEMSPHSFVSTIIGFAVFCRGVYILIRYVRLRQKLKYRRAGSDKD